MLWKDGVGMAEFGMTRVRIGLFQHAFPKDVIVRGVLHKEGTVGRLVGEISAVREAKPGRLINHRNENRVNVHKVDPDLVCKGKSR